MIYGINLGYSNLFDSIMLLEDSPIRVEHLQIGGILNVSSINNQLKQQVDYI